MSSYLILVVDDDPAILDLIAQLLIEEGYPVLAASNGRTALNLAREQLPKLILLDLMMPEMNGWQVVGELKAAAQTRLIPVILLSARRDLATVADDLEVAAFVEKPFDIDELLACVRRILSSNDRHTSQFGLISW
jgi:two-component system, OmpR family, alkaline phosphatase synthesis response regulator PhoP